MFVGMSSVIIFERARKAMQSWNLSTTECKLWLGERKDEVTKFKYIRSPLYMNEGRKQ